MKKVNLTVNKAIYVEFSLLEISKVLMYDWHYNYFKKKFDCTLLFTDTDSLIYEIRGVDDIYDKIYEGKDLFHFRSYPKDSKYYDPTNKKIVGKLKNEANGKIIEEVIGLKSKMYSLTIVDDGNKIKAKEVNRGLVKHSEFRDVLFNRLVMRHNMKRIQSKKHKLGTYDISKISSSCFDDKRYIMDDGITCHSYYHKDIVNKEIKE